MSRFHLPIDCTNEMELPTLSRFTRRSGKHPRPLRGPGFGPIRPGWSQKPLQTSSPHAPFENCPAAWVGLVGPCSDVLVLTSLSRRDGRRQSSIGIVPAWVLQGKSQPLKDDSFWISGFWLSDGSRQRLENTPECALRVCSTAGGFQDAQLRGIEDDRPAGATPGCVCGPSRAIVSAVGRGCTRHCPARRPEQTRGIWGPGPIIRERASRGPTARHTDRLFGQTFRV